MKKKLIITETQYGRIENLLVESTKHSKLVKEIKDFLDANYSPSDNFTRKGGEYFTEPMFEVTVDEELISPKSLYEYVNYKFDTVGESFIKQVIRDWVDGKITNDYKLSKNVSIN